jgi:hypothetical protein
MQLSRTASPDSGGQFRSEHTRRDDEPRDHCTWLAILLRKTMRAVGLGSAMEAHVHLKRHEIRLLHDDVPPQWTVELARAARDANTRQRQECGDPEG